MLHGKVGILLGISNDIVLCQHFHCSVPLRFLFYERKNDIATNPFYMHLFFGSDWIFSFKHSTWGHPVLISMAIPEHLSWCSGFIPCWALVVHHNLEMALETLLDNPDIAKCTKPRRHKALTALLHFLRHYYIRVVLSIIHIKFTLFPVVADPSFPPCTDRFFQGKAFPINR